MNEQEIQEILLENQNFLEQLFEIQELLEKTQLKAVREQNNLIANTSAQENTAEENNVLLSKLFELQEHLEHLELKLSVLPDAVLNSSEENRLDIKYLESENKSLVQQLIQNQEMMEELRNERKSWKEKYSLQQLRLKKLTDKLPEYWEAEKIHVSEKSTSDDCSSIDWTFTNAHIGDRFLETLVISTEVLEDNVNLLIHRTEPNTEVHSPLLKWPSSSTSEKVLRVALTSSESKQSKIALAELGSSDWAFLTSLTTKLFHYIQASGHSHQILQNPLLLSGLKKLHFNLRSWPGLLRYDSIEVDNSPSRPNYLGIKILLKKLSVGGQCWPSLAFTFSTVDGFGRSFGTNPRLEFLGTDSTQVLTSWYAEQSDAQGERLELRFSKPNHMDMKVWNTLADPDKIVLVALISGLSGLLIDHKKHQNNSKLQYNKWIELAGFIKANLKKNIIPPSHQTTTKT